MAYRGLTTSGANYLATRLAQELPVEFTKVQIGAGTPAGNPADVTELQNYKLDAKILKKSQENNTVEITIQVVNDNVEQGFYLKEIGVFVNDDTEKLYWYCNEDNAQYIPAKTDSAIAFEIDVKMEVTNVESPILNWSGQGTWVNKDYLEEVLRNYTPNTRQMTAGKGLTGGGNFTSDKTFNVVSANDGIIVNEDNIQLNPVDDLSNSSTTRALAANQGLILDNKDKGIVGGYNGKFPLTSATKGNIYLLENTQKYYICITDYNGSKLTTPNANFEELSVYTNRSKLDNLSINMEQLIFIKKSGILTEKTSYILSKPIKTGDILFVGLDDCAYNKVMLVYSNNSTSGVITGTYGNQIDCLFTTLISIIGDKLYIKASYGNFTKIANINVYRLSLI
ncbi:phage tail-collar fiber domain-containing protein [Fusobacterium mortiferum]|uniref:phage tail-collar fiber domain-containing protein n=1 Tax=Fusobacterium mortiferum TaxID=850 RepID=UPI00195BDB8E|nr:phage tail protein [Fusobacterium mortiferum]